MKAITESECLHWLGSQGLLTRDYNDPSDIFADMPFKQTPYIRFMLPNDSGHKVALARAIFFQLKLKSDFLLWLRNWMVWPSNAHIPLAIRLRQALGCEQSLEERPGHLFGSGEVDDAISILLIAFEFYWDCLFVDAGQKFVCFVSHDEYMIFMSRDEAHLNQIANVLESAKLCQRTADGN